MIDSGEGQLLWDLAKKSSRILVSLRRANDKSVPERRTRDDDITLYTNNAFVVEEYTRLSRMWAVARSNLAFLGLVLVSLVGHLIQWLGTNYNNDLPKFRQPMPIRKWGCHRNETPTIYVHIGKAGGGQVRARFGAAAVDFDGNDEDKITRRRRRQTTKPAPEHYYPLPGGNKAKFCNSLNRNHRFAESEWNRKTFEGDLPCHASTPLGMALACPNAYRDVNHTCPGCDPTGDTCHSVYVGHNRIGSELHWLPAKYLQQWWRDTGRKLVVAQQQHGNRGYKTEDQESPSLIHILDEGFEALVPEAGPFWCPWAQQHRPLWEVDIESLYETCGVPLANKMDSASDQHHADYSSLYASLPVQRVVLLRDPWTWIVSKFFWHKSRTNRIHCYDLSKVRYPRSSSQGGWANEFLLRYLSYLCGIDCDQRLERGLMTIEQAEAQAANNLRQSFSVVGLLEETQTFYDMVSTRIAYVNMSLNPHVQGNLHSAKKSSDAFLCARMYQNPKFQARFRRAVPLMSVVERLYQLGVQVNRFQQQELNECTGTMLFQGR